MSGGDTVLVWASVLRETEAAIVADTAVGRVTIPLSQVRPESEVWSEGDEGMLAIPRWLAEDRDLPFEER